MRIYGYNFMKFPILLSPNLSHQRYLWYYLSSSYSYKLTLTPFSKSTKKTIWFKKTLCKKLNAPLTTKPTTLTTPSGLCTHFWTPKLPLGLLFFKLSSTLFYARLALWIYNNVFLLTTPNRGLGAGNRLLVSKFPSLYYPKNLKEQLKLL